MSLPSPRRRRVARVLALTLVTLGAASAAAQAAATTAPARVDRAGIGTLRWLEGTWRGRLPDGGWFYERYAFVNDSTIQVSHLRDSTLALAREGERVMLRDGAVRYERAHATRLDASGIDFEGTGAHGFTWAPERDGTWTAIIRGTDRAGRGYSTIYQMERVGAGASQQNDRAAVRRAVLDYVEGFYEGDTTKLARAMWPDVRKWGYSREQNGTFRGMAMAYPSGFMRFAESVRAGRTKTPPNAPKDITIFDVADQTASAKLTAYWGIDYLLLAKENGRWMITHVLWQSPPKKG